MGDTLGRPSCGTFERAPPAVRDGSLGSMATVTQVRGPGPERPHMRVGVLTGGGDCPGLNAVIRAVVRKGVDGVRLRVRRLPRRLARAAGERDHPARRRPGARHPAARRHDPEVLAHQPVQDRGRRRADQGEPRRQRRRRADRDRRRGHPRRGHQARRPRRQRRRRAQDDRQRPVRHRLHLRLRHRGEHRDGGDRPAAHHRRVAPPRAGRRGDGPARRLDRAARRASPAAPTSC